MMKRGIRTAGPAEATPIIAKWRDDWFKEIEGQLRTKRFRIQAATATESAFC